MTIGRILLLVTGMLLATLVWLAWPLYQFYGHRDAVPLGPFGWVELPASAPETNTVYDAGYRLQAEHAMEALRRHRDRLRTPALSAAVAIHGELVWAGTVGWEDIESRTPASTDSMFRIGSTSKAVTATALARLVDAGKMDLDAPINTYLDPLPNDQWKTITPRMLASHMAGLPHYKENTDRIGMYRTVSLGTHYESMADALDVFDESELLFAPGTDFHYSTLGTVLLGAVMGASADTSYREVIREEVLEPVGMDSTIVAPPSADRTPDMTTSYVRDEGLFRPWRPVDQTHRLPGGGWAASSSDLARMGMAWLDASYITPATREGFWTPQELANGQTNPQDYALGFRVRDYEAEGIRAWNANHGGVSRGALSWLLIFPEHDMVLAFNTNAKTASGEFREFGIAWEDLFLAFARAKGSNPSDPTSNAAEPSQ